jgi:hypothetical protein
VTGADGAGAGAAFPRALLREQAPEPGRFWVRYAPRRWPGPIVPWLDLAAGVIEVGSPDGDESVLAGLLERPLDDVLYLPPVPPDLAPARDRLAARHAARGTPVVVQLLPGDPAPDAPEPVQVVMDLTSVALAQDGRSYRADAGASAAALPLLPGGPSGPRLAALADAIAAAGVEALVGVPVELDPRRLRALGGELPEDRYLALFHGAVADLGDVARAAAAAGLAALPERPLPRPPLRGAGNLRVAGALALAGELCLRVGGSEPRAQALLRAARFAERESVDLVALAREGNLAVLPWLDAEGRRVVADAARDTAADAARDR